MSCEAQIARFWARRRRVSKSLRAHSQTSKHCGREWFRCVMELTASYVNVFCTVHCFLFYYNCYYYFSWFSDPYTKGVLKPWLDHSFNWLVRLWFVELFTFADKRPLTISRVYLFPSSRSSWISSQNPIMFALLCSFISLAVIMP